MSSVRRKGLKHTVRQGAGLGLGATTASRSLAPYVITTLCIDRLRKHCSDGNYLEAGTGLRILPLSLRCDLFWIVAMTAIHLPQALHPALPTRPWL